MPEKRTIARARRKARAGRRPSTQAGEFVREEIRHVREGRHGARSAKQAIAIGLSKARRAGVKLGPPPGRKKVVRGKFPKSTRRARAVKRALEREPRSAASHRGSPGKRIAAQRAQPARRRPESGAHQGQGGAAARRPKGRPHAQARVEAGLTRRRFR
jgi:hypothetical protein